MPQKILSKTLSKLIVIAAVCLSLIFLNPKGIFSPLRQVFFTLAYPFQKTFFFLGRTMGGASSFLGSIGSLRAENEQLLRENNALFAQVGALRTAQQENDLLREQLQLIPRDKFQLEAAFVVSRDPQGLGSWIMIDKGSSAGLIPGMPVIVSDGILIGKIDAVYASSAKVSLLSDSNSVVNALDIETEAKGIIRGEYGLGLTLDMVAQTDVLNVGDIVVTSGLGGDLPKGLTIGKIQEVRSTPDKLFQQAVLMPRIKYSKLETIFVIKN